jgi:leader peptidase (prepilin peptidase)/N-methyltransferase
MSGDVVAVAGAAAVAGLLAGPFLQRVVDNSPPDPDDDPPPVPRVGPWLSRTKLLGVLLAALNAGAAVRFGVEASLPAHLVFVACLVTVSVIDLDLFLIPNRVIYPSLAAMSALLAIAAVIDGNLAPLRTAAIGGVGAWVALLIVHLINPAGMGFGDVRLAAVIGVGLGWLGYAHVVGGLFAGFATASVVGLTLLVIRRKGRKDPVPFGPFLAAGALFILLGGDRLLGL